MKSFWYLGIIVNILNLTYLCYPQLQFVKGHRLSDVLSTTRKHDEVGMNPLDNNQSVISTLNELDAVSLLLQTSVTFQHRFPLDNSADVSDNLMKKASSLYERVDVTICQLNVDIFVDKDVSVLISVLEHTLGPYVFDISVHKYFKSLDQWKAYKNDPSKAVDGYQISQDLVCSASIDRALVSDIAVFIHDHFPGVSGDKPIRIPQEILESPLALKRWIRERYSVLISLKLSGIYPHPVEIKWVHSSGNSKLVPLARNHEPWILYPGETFTQYTIAGNIFAIMSWTSDMYDCEKFEAGRCRLRDTQLNDYFTHQSSYFDQIYEFHRIESLLFIPAIYNEQHEHHFYMEHRDIQEIIDSELLLARERYFRPFLYQYWTNQRMARVNMQYWLLPDLPSQWDGDSCESKDPSSPNRTHSAVHRLETDITRSKACLNPSSKNNEESLNYCAESYQTDVLLSNSLWLKFSLPNDLFQRLRGSYDESKSQLMDRVETPISMVFNQNIAETKYVPIHRNYMKELELFIQKKTSSWLNVTEDSLIITGSYGCREYGHNAVIRWHTDPAESQPLTAIVHISDDRIDASVLTNETHDINWGIQIPKYLPTSSNFIYFYEDQSGLQSMTSIELETIYLEEGEVLLIQSGKLPHARLFPYQKYSYANAFIHLAPKGWESRDEVQNAI